AHDKNVGRPMVLGALLTACTQDHRPTDILVVGEPFPNIPLVSLNGEAATLADYRGKLVVLNLWATWCEPCRREMPNLQQLSDMLDTKRFAVLGVAGEDDAHVAREYLRDKEITFASHIDVGQEVATHQLGVQLYPYTFIIGPDGVFLQRYPGPREWHRPEVIELLESAFNGDYSDL
ncbi:TlpA family protein disulfide reductase, partial [Pseudomonadota bacterium]